MNTSASAADRHEMDVSTAPTLERASLGPPGSMETDRESDPVRAEQRAERRWYVARTQRHAEAHAVANLERQNFPTFCPRFRKSRRHARRVESVLVPLFPSYIFVRLDLSCDRWRSVNGTRGVAHLLTRGEMPQAVTPGVVESLQQRLRADGTVDLTPELKVGQSVRLAFGPFADFIGTLERLDSAGRVRVLIDLLGRSVSVAVKGEALLPAG